MSKRKNTIRFGIVQMSMGKDPAANLAHAMAGCREAAAAGADIVCLPELFQSRYFCQTEDDAFFELAEPVPGATTDKIAEVATDTGTTIIASLFEARAAGLYHNTVAVIDASRGFLGKYRKMHIPDDPRYYEKYYFTPGDLGFKTFATDKANIGTLICWDQWYPEAARLTAMKGAQVLTYPTAIGWHPEEKDTHGEAQHAAWETMQRSHAIANGCYVVAVNRYGFEPDPASAGGIEFWGQSFIAGPDGQVIVRAPADADAVLVVELDLGAIARQRHGWPFFRDRRIDVYEPLSLRFGD